MFNFSAEVLEPVNAFARKGMFIRSLYYSSGTSDLRSVIMALDPLDNAGNPLGYSGTFVPIASGTIHELRILQIVIDITHDKADLTDLSNRLFKRMGDFRVPQLEDLLPGSISRRELEISIRASFLFGAIILLVDRSVPKHWIYEHLLIPLINQRDILGGILCEQEKIGSRRDSTTCLSYQMTDAIIWTQKFLDNKS
jgi:hypothetical protein